MSHSHEQKRKKAHAHAESLHHAQHSNVLHVRDGKKHEDHKLAQLEHESPAEEMAEYGHPLDGIHHAKMRGY